MRIIASIFVDATEPIRVNHRADLNVSYIHSGGEYDISPPLSIKGTLDERAEFLLRLANAANEAAVDLMAGAEMLAASARAREAREQADLEALRVKLTGGAS